MRSTSTVIAQLLRVPTRFSELSSSKTSTHRRNYSFLCRRKCPTITGALTEAATTVAVAGEAADTEATRMATTVMAAGETATVETVMAVEAVLVDTENKSEFERV